MFFLNKLNPKQSLFGIIVCIALLAVLPFVAKELGGNVDVARRKSTAKRSPARIASYISKYITKAFEEGAKFCENVLSPLNRSGDEEGCHFDNGVVTTPAGFKQAFTHFIIPIKSINPAGNKSI